MNDVSRSAPSLTGDPSTAQDEAWSAMFLYPVRNVGYVVAIILLSCTTFACTTRGLSVGAPSREPRPGLWPGLESGRYAVGYTVRHIHDTTRTFPTDTSTKLDADGAAARPIQISIWYPAEGGSGNPILTIRDYLSVAASEIDFEATGSEGQKAALAKAIAAIVEAGVPRSRLEWSLKRRTLATRDPDSLPGPFPLVVYSPGLGADAFQNLVACEYLASHGFVVAAIPSLGTRTREVTASATEIETGVRDLEVVLDQISSFADVDPGRIGVIGYSWGGLVVAFLAMHRADIDAVATLDGSLMVKHHYELARSSPGYDLSKLKQPILLFVANAREWKARTLEFFEALHGADVRLVRFNDLFHGDFSSTIIELVLHNLDDPGRDVTRVDIAFAWQCRYLLAFMNTYLADDDKSRGFLNEKPEANGVPENLLSIEGSAPAHEPA